MPIPMRIEREDTKQDQEGIREKKHIRSKAAIRREETSETTFDCSIRHEKEKEVGSMMNPRTVGREIRPVG